MSRQEQLELQNSSGATTCSHHQETAGCPAESPSKKGSQAFPIWKPRLPANTMSQGREAHEDSLGQDCLSLPQKQGMDRNLTHISQLCPATLEMSQWLSCALFPQLTWVPQSIQGPYEGRQGPFCLQPTCWIWTSQEESAPHLPSCSLQPREEYTDLD